MSSREILLGSGKLYLLECDTSSIFYKYKIPSNEEFETDSNYAGAIQGGATLQYSYETINFMCDNDTKSSAVVNQEVKFKTGVLTFSMNFLEKLLSSSVLDESDKTKTLKIGSEVTQKHFFIRFVTTQPNGKNLRLTFIGNNEKGLDIPFSTEDATVINIEFTSSSTIDEDGNLLIIEQEK